MAVFVQPPSVEVLRNRLVNRSSDSPEVIATRVAKAEYELTFAPKFDVILVNDRIDDAFNEVELIVSQFLSK